MKIDIKIIRLNFFALFNQLALNCAGVLLLHLLISYSVMKLAKTPGPAGVGDIIPLICVLVMGIVFFSPVFKYALSLGISRKKLFRAASLSLAALAGLLALMTLIFYLINLQVANVWMLFYFWYPGANLLEMVVWEWLAMLFLGILGWAVRLVYYVSGRTVRWIVSTVPFIIGALVILFDAIFQGGIWDWIRQAAKSAGGLSVTPPEPWIAAASLLIGVIILELIVYLLLRRAQAND